MSTVFDSKTAHQNVVSTLSFSPDGQTLLSGSWDGTAKLWEVVPGKLVRTVADDWESVRAVAFSPDGRSLVIGGLSNSDFTSAELEQYQSYFATGDTCFFNRSPTNSGEPLPLRIYDAASGGLRLALAYGSFALAMAPDEGMVAATDGDVQSWATATGRALWTWKPPDTNHISRLCYSVDGHSLAAIARERVFVLNALTGDLMREMPVSYETDHCLDAVEDAADILRFWQTSLAQFRPLDSSGDNYPHFAIAFSPNGKVAALVDGIYTNRNAVRLWDLEQVRLIRTLLSPDRRQIRALAFAPDGALLATAGDDHRIRLWEVETGQFVSTLGVSRAGVAKVFDRWATSNNPSRPSR